MEHGEKCFTRMELGNQQYASLKKWLQHGQLIEISNKDRSIHVTGLGDKLIQLGPYNPLTWAIIWCNLSYNSIICKWFCINTEPGVAYELGDIVTLLGDSYSPTTRKNAASSLLATFKHSPIGTSLKQGIPIEKSYLREGWDYPHAVALLYALYLYAEHTGRKSFTFTELLNAHTNPDAQGISPHDIYGIDAKAFRNQVQGLAISYPQYIRVSFIGNLDNIILEDFASNDILDLAKED